MRFEPLTLPLNTSNGFLGDPEDPNSAKRYRNPGRPQVAGSPLGRDCFDWSTCPHGCNWRRCAGDEPDCAFIRHHFPSDVSPGDPLLINSKDWPINSTVIPGEGQNSLASVLVVEIRR
jgi:hypothetical protein